MLEILLSFTFDYIIYIPSYVVGLRGSIVPHHRHARSVHENLLEVPSNVGVLNGLVEQLLLTGEHIPGRRAQRFKKFVQGVFIFSIYIDFLEHMEVRCKPFPRSHMRDAVQDLFTVATRFLLAKLVAGKP